jgi:replicative DNA helicase
LDNNEPSIIASRLLVPDALVDLVGKLYPSHFANPEPALIYDAMRGLCGRGAGVNPTAVVEELRRRKQLTSELECDVHELWGSSGSAANVPWCADQIIAAWQDREMTKACAETIKALQAPDVVNAGAIARRAPVQ